jgi:hypothetical protein
MHGEGREFKASCSKFLSPQHISYLSYIVDAPRIFFYCRAFDPKVQNFFVSAHNRELENLRPLRNLESTAIQDHIFLH